MDKHIESLREKLETRSEVGLKKYGVGLDRDDLSTLEWLNHLQEELLDAAGYVERLMSDLSWQQIETIPTDGTPVDVWHKTGGRMVDVWVTDDGGLSNGLPVSDFTHWEPISSPPIDDTPSNPRP